MKIFIYKIHKFNVVYESPSNRLFKATEYITLGISQPELYGDIVNKIRRIKGKQHNHRKYIRIIKRLLYRGYDPTVTKRTLGMVLDQSTALYQRILKICTLTDCDDGTP